MGRRKCTPKQLAALRRGREKAHRRSKKNTKGLWAKSVDYCNRWYQKQNKKLNIPLHTNLPMINH